MKKYAALIPVCLLLAGCLGCSTVLDDMPAPEEASPESTVAAQTDTPVPQQEGGESAGETAVGGYGGPEFSASAVTGETVDEGYVQENRLTMVNFWATWCGPCVGEMPDLAELHKNYAGQGFGILGVMVDEDTEAALSLIEQYDITYPIILVSGDLVEMSSNFRYVPTTVFLDSNGAQVGEIRVGSKDYAGWSALIDELIKGLS